MVGVIVYPEAVTTSTMASRAPQQQQQRRRAEIIDAAMRAFARKGFGGSTLADIAAEAGVSQPRISQVFGSKENAFIAAHRKAADEILKLLEENAQPPYSMAALGRGVREHLWDRPEAMMVIFQGLTGSYVPAIGEESRRFITEVVDIVRRAGGTADDARAFLERGYFIHAMVASGALRHADEDRGIGDVLGTIQLDSQIA